MTISPFPSLRLRRTRYQEWTRKLVAETHVTPHDLICPLFVQEGEDMISSIPGLQDVYRYSLDRLLEHVQTIQDVGIQAVALFPVVDAAHKTPDGSAALQSQNLIARSIRAIKGRFPDIGVIADVALDPYTTHGHDGIWVDGDVDNDQTLEMLGKQAVMLAQAGADVVAPSDMMDGRVGVIRRSLDEQGFSKVLIFSYAVKYASSFYGPFRQAVGSAAPLGASHKKTYQMDWHNSDEALREVAQDLDEGADWVMIKPAIHYLDILSRIRQNFNVPVFAYHVSGEYAMLKNAITQGWVGPDAYLETLVAIKRAGATGIITYGAVDAARYLLGMPL